MMRKVEHMKTCLITGANAGIGKAAAVQMAQKGYRVIMACRSVERGQSALFDVKKQSGSSDVSLLTVDMSLQSSIRHMARQFYETYDALDVLISNAAAFDISQKQAIKTAEGIESVWATNHLGPIRSTSCFPRFKRANRDASSPLRLRGWSCIRG